MAELTRSQAQAFGRLQNFLYAQNSTKTAVLEGWAGTGKTFLVSQLLNSPERKGRAIAVAAPTNKAVRVLRDAFGSSSGSIEFGSIHSFLGLRMTENEDGSQSCVQVGQPSLDLFHAVIVDEASMIGDWLFDLILKSSTRTKVLFVGDEAQLPPVKGGNNTSPAFSRTELKVRLDEIVRQRSGSPILTVASEIRQAVEGGSRCGLDEIAKRRKGMQDREGVHYGEGGKLEAIQLAYDELTKHADCRIVAYTNAAVRFYNTELHSRLYGKGSLSFVPGERGILNAQSEAIDAHSGEELVLITNEEVVVELAVPDESSTWPEISALRIVARCEDGRSVTFLAAENEQIVETQVSDLFSQWRKLKDSGHHQDAKKLSDKAWSLRRAFAPLRHAYAITAHKSQGSTFDSAILDVRNLERIPSHFAFNRAVYVAATRPRHKLFVVN